MKTLLLSVFLGIFIVNAVYPQNLYLSGGNTHSVAICENGSVLAWGLNNVGQVGVRADLTAYPLGSYSTPQQVYGLPAPPNGVSQIDAGSGSHTLALACNTNVYAWGLNSCGQLGNGVATTNCGTATDIIQALPVRVLTGEQGHASTFLSNAKYVSGGNDQSFAILTSGELMAWGQGTKGELGNGLFVNSSTPVYVKTATGVRLTGVTQVDAGDENCYALAGGIVYSWGDAADGGGTALGRATANNAFARPVLKADGTSLNNIVSLSAGDRHGLAIDANGNVWSWGGDWGPGQLGQGDGGQFGNLYAALVKAPAAEGSCAAGSGPYLSGVVSIAAGQAHSLAVLSDGRVVSWGSNGFFNCGANCASKAGQLGIGMLADGSTGAQTGVECPKYVQTNATTQLQNIVSVSDGDAWSFAVSSTGQIYVWGWNKDGQLGLGTTGVANNKTYATALNLPGCTFAAPCPTANLGANVQVCPVYTKWLFAGSTGSTFSYTWEYKATLGAASWTLESGPVVGPLGDSLLANKLGFYRVTISDTRSTVTCAPCPTVSDTIQISQTANPYTVDACADAGVGMARFSVTAPAASQIKWYTNSTGGTALNPANSDPTITTDFSNTNTTTPGCSRALFAEDIGSFIATMGPATTAGIGCAGTDAESGTRSPHLFNAFLNFNLTSVDILQPPSTNGGTINYTVRIYANNPAAGWNGSMNIGAPGAQVFASAVTSFPENNGNVATVRTIPVNFNAIAGNKYWLAVDGNNGVRYFSCAGTFPYVPTSPAGSHANIERVARDGNPTTPAPYGHAFNWKLTVGSGYSCGRILVCVSNTCLLPVEYLSFTATKQGFNALLNWTTANEKNSSYFIIEKSSDGLSFSSIGRVEASGNSHSAVNYSFTDFNFGSGTSYYTLAQYDLDASVNYSEILSLSKSGIKEVKVVPNPNNGSFVVIMEAIVENLNVKLILRNALGQVVFEGSESSASVNTINIQHLPSAIYFLEVQTEEGNLISKIIKE